MLTKNCIILVCALSLIHIFLFTIADNGMGIPEEAIEFLLTDTQRVHKKGSGVGLVNVNNRIKILFGEKYGLHIESELD